MLANTSFDALLVEDDPDGLRVRHDVAGSSLTTFALGGRVRTLVEPRSLRACLELLWRLDRQEIPWRVLGAGSNLLLPDNGIDDVVLRLGGEFNKCCLVSEGEVTEDGLEKALGGSLGSPVGDQSFVEGEEVRILAFAGCSLMGLSTRLSRLGVSGLEFGAGIPGSLGGAVRMNAGAHGSSIEEIVSAVFVADPSGRVRKLSRDEMGFSYRRSVLPGQTLVLAAEVLLRGDSCLEVMRRRSECLDYRKRTQPLQFPSAGCAFRNPGRSKGASVPWLEARCLSAGEMLDKVGLRGEVRGGVSFSEMHANWLIKIADHAESTNALLLLEEGRRRVKESFGIELEQEIIVW